jgi:ZIP family zinc transporter/zinc and cadmium transporter
MILTTIAYGLIAACAEVLGGFLVLFRKQWPRTIQEYLLGLSAGFILALVFLELVPESMSQVGGAAPLLMLAGYAFLHFFEHTIVGHLHFGEETHHDVMLSRMASYSTFGGLMVHAFFDGFAISAGMQFDFFLGLLIFIAVLLHKIPEGLTVATVMLAADLPRRTALIASVAVGASTLVGVGSVFLLADLNREIVGMAFAFSAGIATYVGASDLIPEINHSRNRLIPLTVFVGMVLFYAGKVILGPLAGQ